MAASEALHKVFTLAGLRTAARQTPALLRVPQPLQDAISSFLAEHSSRHVKRSVLQLAMEMRDRKQVVAVGEKAWTVEEVDVEPSAFSRAVAAEFLSDSSVEKKWKPLPVQASVKYEAMYTAAYVAARMPAIYAVLQRVFSEVSHRVPDFKPATVLDFGSGPGTVLWAMREVWPASLKHVNLLERSPAMSDACRQLLKDQEGLPTIKSFGNLQNFTRSLKHSSRLHDVVVASYALGELPSMAERVSAVRQLWSLTKDMLVLIEPGTPEGFSIVQELRKHILQMEEKKMRKLRRLEVANSGRDGTLVDDASLGEDTSMRGGAFVVAPCAHDGACPMENTGKWCHFAQRLERTPSQRVAKRSTKAALRGYEDEKFSFVVLRHGTRPRAPWPMSVVTEDASNDNGSSTKSSGEKILSEGLQQAAGGTDEQAERERRSDSSPSDSEEEADWAQSDTQPHGNFLSNQQEGPGEETHIELVAANRVYEQDDSASEQEFADLGGGWARIVHPPLKRGGHVLLDVCCAKEGDPSHGELHRLAAVRSGTRALYLQARKSRWGDLWPC